MAASNFSMQCGPLVAAFIVGALVGGTAGTFVLCCADRLVSAPSNSRCRRSQANSNVEP
jgi:hypothetical protein